MKKDQVTYQVIAPVVKPAKKVNGLSKKVPEEFQIEIIQELVTDLKKTYAQDLEDPYKFEGVREKVFADRYSLKDAQGKATEFHPEEMWMRVAAGISKEEQTPELRREWAGKFYESMKDFKFVPAGRILSGAGTGYEVTFFNCYVIPSPKDSRGGIMENITHTVEIQARGGGVGINLSSLRPNGSRVKKVNGTSSGPVSWAKLYSAANHDVIQQGGSRRGALMLMLHDWHPDIIEFIHAKEDGKSIPGANLSICISDGFMQAVEEDAQWVTKFPDMSDPEYDELWDGDIEKWESLGKPVKIYETYKAKEIWDQICTSAWASAEPGLHFLERSNKWSNTWYFEKLLSTNPSLRAGTKVLTKEGIFSIEELEGKRFYVKNLGGEWSIAECFLSGKNKELYKLTLSSGKEIYATAEHKWPVLSVGGGFGKVTTDKLQAGNILPFPKTSDIQFESKNSFTKEEGFMLGWLYGDGWISERKTIVKNTPSLIRSEVVGNGLATYSLSRAPQYSQSLYQGSGQWTFGFLFSDEDKSMVQSILPEINKLKKTPSSLTRAHGNTYTIQTSSVEFSSNLFNKFGIDSKDKGLPPTVWNSGGDYIKGFVDGLFSSDGFVSKKARRMVFTTKHKKLAHDVADLLSFYGIKSHIRREETTEVKFPNGKKYYKTYERYDVTIDGYHAVNFSKIFTLSHARKQQNLSQIGQYVNARKSPDAELTRIVSVEKTNIKEDVWDISVFDDTHCFYINHCVTGNCGEQPLGAWAVCNLGAMNLSAFVDGDGLFDFDNLDKNVRTAMRFMDNVVDANYYFWEQNEIAAKDIRRTGIGTMGLGDALIKMKIKYGSEESIPVIEKIYKIIRDAAYEVSSDLAAEKGAFPKFEKEKYLQGHFIKRLPENIKEKIAKQGIRNAVILTQAPTGTTSLLAGVSSGIEPVFDFKFIRRDRIGEHVIYHPLYVQWQADNPDKPYDEKPSYYVGANDLNPLDHVRVQAKVQEYTDSSISKTANAPFDYTVDQVKELYMQAYKLGCKGVTFFRDGSRAGVLYHEEKKEEKKEQTDVAIDGDAREHRPMVLRGRTYEIMTPVGKAFVTVNRDDNDLPFEVFITVGKGGMHTMADAEAMGRLTSIALRVARKNRLDIAQNIVEQLRGIGGASHVGFGKDRIMSLADAIAKILSEEVSLAKKNEETKESEQQALALTTEKPSGATDDVVTANAVQQLPLEMGSTAGKQADLCPECGAASFVMEEGCQKCYSCGYSKC